YDAYASPIALWGGTPVRVRATIRDGRFAIELEAWPSRITPRTRVILLNTPWNPVGTVFTADELRDVLGLAEAHDLIVLSDEIYETLIYDGRRHVAFASLSEAAREKTVLINSLSKTYAMTGWRVGYVAA